MISYYNNLYINVEIAFIPAKQGMHYAVNIILDQIFCVISIHLLE